MDIELNERDALIAFGFLAFGLGVWFGRISAEVDLMSQIEEFQANGGKIIPPEPQTIDITQSCVVEVI